MIAIAIIDGVFKVGAHTINLTFCLKILLDLLSPSTYQIYRNF